MTPDQCRAARLLLGWSRDRLSAQSGTALNFLTSYERKGRVPRPDGREPEFDRMGAVRAALEQAGVEFTNDGPGVKLRKPGP